MTKVRAGDDVQWWRVRRGGQGFTEPVAGRVVRVTDKRVIIETARDGGGLKRVAVRHVHVKWALGASPR